MKKYCSLLFVLTFKATLLFSQKPAIDTNSLKNWVSTGEGFISNDGDYAGYYIHNDPPGRQTLVVRSTHGEWMGTAPDAAGGRFSTDGRLLVFKKGKDSLGLMLLGGTHTDYIGGVGQFALFDAWLIYRPETPAKAIVVRNLADGRERRIDSVVQYALSASGKFLAIKTTFGLQTVDLSSGVVRSIWPRQGHSESVSNFAISHNGQRIAFIVDHSLWLHQVDNDSCAELPIRSLSAADKGLRLSGGGLSFTQDDSAIFVRLSRPSSCKPTPGAAGVDVWSYRDKVVQTVQMDRKDQESSYSAIYPLQSRALIRLEKDGEREIATCGNFVLVQSPAGGLSEWGESGWNVTVRPSYYLISLQDPTVRVRICGPLAHQMCVPAFSTGGKWVIYYDVKQRSYFSYEIATGIRRNITKGFPTSLISVYDDLPFPDLTWNPRRQTWLKGDEGVLINDNYDIWIVDPAARRKPVCLTNGYGRAHRIRFELVDDGSLLQGVAINSIRPILMEGFDQKNKDRGFYSTSPSVGADPKLLTKGPFVYGDWDGDRGGSTLPIKAKEAGVYLIRRQSAFEAPNYFVTIDFIHFSPLSDIQPQQGFNWLTTEAIHWKTFDGRISSGILYKPENFDASRKYPILFDYYERRSDELNLYIEPALAQGRINIPCFVSNGYLVCVPDIRYTIGSPMKSAYNSVVSAALYLSKKPWVDKAHMGLQGHSFGGYETNYIVTHSKLFAAACSASGISDLISMYGSVLAPWFSHEFWTEDSQGRMGGTLWQRPGDYIEASPIFRADSVVTPLLMMNNKQDDAVAFSQGVELFMALRRLGKRVWMLQYDGQGHELHGSTADEMDLTIRMTQFFDHYLKGARPPKWMTRGVPAALKGCDSGLELDHQIATPGPGLTEK